MHTHLSNLLLLVCMRYGASVLQAVLVQVSWDLFPCYVGTRPSSRSFINEQLILCKQHKLEEISHFKAVLFVLIKSKNMEGK